MKTQKHLNGKKMNWHVFERQEGNSGRREKPQNALQVKINTSATKIV
jgi:hypothetical protein